MEERWLALHEGQIRPTKSDLKQALGRTVADVLVPGLQVLFCGINPGLYTAAVGHHFARPGNRFWAALQCSGFTERLYSPYEEEALLAKGVGITNLVPRATRGAGELSRGELRRGVGALAGKVAIYRPHTVAVFGLGAYRVGFGRPRAGVGPQPEKLESALIWVLPNPSGVNAHYQLSALVQQFRQLREAVQS